MFTNDFLELCNKPIKLLGKCWKITDCEIRDRVMFEPVKMRLSLIEMESDYSINKGLSAIKKVIFNGPATIVFWEDGTKTVVKCAEGENYDKRVAIMWAVMKKMHGNSSRVNKILDKLIEKDEKIEDEVKSFKDQFVDEAKSFTEQFVECCKNLANASTK